MVRANANGKSILVVEDEPGHRQGLYENAQC